MSLKSRERARDGALSAFDALPATPLVSVVIPALNEERYVGACLEALEAQSYPAEALEVIVADGGSIDRTREIVRLHGATTSLRRIDLVDNPEKTTPTGLNAAIAASKGEVVVNVIAHVVTDRDFIANCVATLRSSDAAAAGGPVATAPGSDTVVAAGIAAALSHPLSVGNAVHRFGKKATDADTLYYAAYRRGVFDYLGGFDPERLQSEDDTLNLKVREAGGRLRFDPSIRSTYHARPTFRALALQYFRFGRAKALAARAENNVLSGRHLVPPAAGFAGAGGLLAALVRPALRLPLLAIALTYAVAVSWAGIRTARERGRPYAGLAAAAAFPVIHGSYAVGMAWGAIGQWLGRESDSAKEP